MVPRVCTNLKSEAMLLLLHLLVPIIDGRIIKGEVILWVEFGLGG
jgi:hypothetical protein